MVNARFAYMYLFTPIYLSLRKLASYICAEQNLVQIHFFVQFKNGLSSQSYMRVIFCFSLGKAPDSDRKDLMSELELMKKLKPHPHVIKLMGCVTETGNIHSKSNK